MLLDEGLDSGPVLAQREEAVFSEDTAGSLGERLAMAGATLMAETLGKMAKRGVDTRATRRERGDDDAPSVEGRWADGLGDLDGQAPGAESAGAVSLAGLLHDLGAAEAEDTGGR